MPPVSPDIPPRSSGANTPLLATRSSAAAPSPVRLPDPSNLEIALRMRLVIGTQTFQEISERTGANHETVRRYFLHGRPSISFLATFCRVYDVRADWILTGIGSPQRNGSGSGNGLPVPSEEPLTTDLVIRNGGHDRRRRRAER